MCGYIARHVICVVVPAILFFPPFSASADDLQVPQTCPCGCGMQFSQCDMGQCPAKKQYQKQLTQAIRKAAQDNSTDCANSVAAAAETFGISDLTGKRAKEQIEFMDANWDKVSATEAQNRANIGNLVVAGRPEEGNDHVAMVEPGALDPKYHQPRLAGGSYNSSTPGKPGVAFSTDGKTVSQIWNLHKVPLSEIKYYAPPSK